MRHNFWLLRRIQMHRAMWLNNCGRFRVTLQLKLIEKHMPLHKQLSEVAHDKTDVPRPTCSNSIIFLDGKGTTESVGVKFWPGFSDPWI
jgi:hypothetical protein